MKKYFVYYSATGNGDFLSELLKEAGYEPVKVETVKPMGKVGFFKILHYGGQAMMNKKARIKELNVDFQDDDLVVVGSPIWNDRLSTPINAILAKYNFNKETTGFVLYPAGEGTKKSKEQIKKLGFIKEPVVISYPLKKQEEAKELIKLVK